MDGGQLNIYIIFYCFKSLVEKLGTLMQRPGEDVVPKDEVPWWMKYAGRGIGTVGSGSNTFYINSINFTWIYSVINFYY